MITVHVTRKFQTRVSPTPRVQECAAMFGIGVDESIDIVLYEDAQVVLGERRVIFITGESGAGKSCMLRDILSAADAHEGLRLVPTPDVTKVPDAPVIDQFGDWNVQRTTALLNAVGIAEAFIYLRKPRELSDGQRYRFMLALMIYDAVQAREGGDLRTPVVGIDEYLAFLDRETARNVAYQTRRAVSDHRLCLVAATTHHDIVRDLQPNLTFTLRLNRAPERRQSPLAGV